jgi:biotin synthase
MIREVPQQATEDRIIELAQQVLADEPITRQQAHELAAIDINDEAWYDLLYWANKIRLRKVGNTVTFCSIVTGKLGACAEDCGFCAQSKHHKTHVTPDKMTTDQMDEAAQEAARNGANSFGIVNSGKGPTDRELDWMQPFFEKTADEEKIRPCATLGELRPDQAQRLRDMGVERINHNLETSRRHFPNVVSTHTYEDRVATLKAAKAAGLSLCSGGIFGMGETWDDRFDMLLELREIGADVVPLNFFYPIPGTAFHGKYERMAPREALKMVAIARFLLPDRELKIAGGRESVLRDLQSWVFYAGANSFLIGNYLTTFGRSPQQDHQMLQDLGLSYRTYDEVEREADPTSADDHGPGNPSAAKEGSLMSKRDGSLVALPVMNSGEKPLEPIGNASHLRS